ncbi:MULTISPECIES: hypothetical protein [unclassified Methylobacterium]|uniref:hypothetical protein n=1 Tax=unclassified Methylobacterium TaxID=2615210 RepID=UPI00034BFD76|nr:MULTISPECIES: hypothetical protein [unclassified Methylobacterium]MBN4094790.1 hypothetical protein [Methylobacterium sp. OT2]
MTRRRDFDALSEAQIAADRTQVRWVEPRAGFRPAGPRAVSDLLDTIQHVAEAATGERSFLHLRPEAGRPRGR